MGPGRLGTDCVEGMFGSTREHMGHVADLPARLDRGVLHVDGFDRARTFAIQPAQVGASTHIPRTGCTLGRDGM